MKKFISISYDSLRNEMIALTDNGELWALQLISVIDMHMTFKWIKIADSPKFES